MDRTVGVCAKKLTRYTLRSVVETHRVLLRMLKKVLEKMVSPTLRRKGNRFVETVRRTCTGENERVTN